MYAESLEHYLEVFVSFLQDTKPLPPDLLTHPCSEVFISFLKSKLMAPQGWRSADREEGEIFDLDEDDRDAFSDQLSSIGCIARFVPSHSLPVLVRAMGECVSGCLRVLEAVQRDPGTLYSVQGTLESTYEDLHWLVLISTFTLCDIVKGWWWLKGIIILEYK